MVFKKKKSKADKVIIEDISNIESRIEDIKILPNIEIKNNNPLEVESKSKSKLNNSDILYDNRESIIIISFLLCLLSIITITDYGFIIFFILFILTLNCFMFVFLKNKKVKKKISPEIISTEIQSSIKEFKKLSFYKSNFGFIIIFEILCLFYITAFICQIIDSYFIYLLNIDVSSFNLKYIDLICCVYISSSLILCMCYARIMKFACINSIVAKYRISWLSYFASTSLSLVFHLILIIYFQFPLLFARLIGFAIDITIFDIFITWVESNLKVNASVMDLSIKKVNYTKNFN